MSANVTGVDPPRQQFLASGTTASSAATAAAAAAKRRLEASSMSSVGSDEHPYGEDTNDCCDSSINDPVLRRYSREYSRDFPPPLPPLMSVARQPPTLHHQLHHLHQHSRWYQQSGYDSTASTAAAAAAADSRSSILSTDGLPRQSPATGLFGDRRSQLEASSRISGLQLKLQAEESARKRLKIDTDQQINRLRDENIRLQCREDGEGLDRGRLTAELEGVRAEYQDYRAQKQRCLDECERQIVRLNREKLDLEERASTEKEQLAREVKELRNRVFELTTRELRLKDDLEDAKLQAELSSKELTTWKAHMSERESELAEAARLKSRLAELELQAKRHELERARLKSANEAIDKYEQLRQQNARLKEQLAAAKQVRDDRLVLEEEARSLRTRLEEAEARAGHLVAELASAAAERRSSTPADPAAAAAVAVSASRLAAVQRELALATSGRAELLTAAADADRSLAGATAARAEAADRAAKAEAAAAKADADLAEVRRRLGLVCRERDMLKEFVASYRLDSTLSGTEQAYLRRIGQLESLLDDYRHQLDRAGEAASTRLSLPAQTQQQQPQPPPARLSLCDLAAKQEASLVSELRQQIAELHKRLAAADEEKEALAAREARLSDLGDADPRFTRVVHLIRNPAQDAEDARDRELAGLRKKLEKAVTRCELLEKRLQERDAAAASGSDTAAAAATSSAAGGGSGVGPGDTTRDVSMLVGRTDLLAQIERLQSDLQKKDLQKQRQFEAFKASTDKMNEAVHRLLGYVVELETPNPSDRLFRVRSTFVHQDQRNRDRTSFLFRLDDSQVHLLTTDYVSEWSSDVRHYVEENNSIPAFLAAVTLNYFGSSTTMATSAAGSTTVAATMQVD